jgi:hypothetical protein
MGSHGERSPKFETKKHWLFGQSCSTTSVHSRNHVSVGRRKSLTTAARSPSARRRWKLSMGMQFPSRRRFAAGTAYEHHGLTNPSFTHENRSLGSKPASTRKKGIGPISRCLIHCAHRIRYLSQQVRVAEIDLGVICATRSCTVARLLGLVVFVLCEQTPLGVQVRLFASTPQLHLN